MDSDNDQTLRAMTRLRESEAQILESPLFLGLRHPGSPEMSGSTVCIHAGRKNIVEYDLSQ